MAEIGMELIRMRMVVTKWMKIASYLLVCKLKKEKTTLTKVKDELRISFSYTQRMLAKFDDNGWITKKGKGRINQIQLTKKGEGYAEKCLDLIMSLEKDNVI